MCCVTNHRVAAAGGQTINMRVRPEQKRRIAAAAEIENAGLTAFVLGAAEEKAERVLAAHATTIIPAEFFDAFYASLDEPARANPALAAVAARRRRVTQR